MSKKFISVKIATFIFSILIDVWNPNGQSRQFFTPELLVPHDPKTFNQRIGQWSWHFGKIDMYTLNVLSEEIIIVKIDFSYIKHPDMQL